MDKTVIVGLDGVPFSMIKDLAERSIMPATAALISRGRLGRMESSVPEVSSVAWSSIITGKNPGEHGIFGFTDIAPNSYKIRFPNYRDLGAAPFWEASGKDCIIINVPSTYPVREMRGSHISGFVSLAMEKSVFPANLLVKLREFDYRLDVDSQLAHESMERFLEDLNLTLDARVRALRYLRDNHKWQIFMIVFTGTDRLLHFLWDAYENKEHLYHEAFMSYFRRIDKAVAEAAEMADADDRLIMLSDHGFERLNADVYINTLLREVDLLRFKSGQKPSLENIDRATKAFALDPARIYINWKDRYPCGSVNKEDGEAVLADMEEMFSKLELGGRKVVQRTLRKEDIYAGPFADTAPDMVLLPGRGFNLKAKIDATMLFGKGIFNGKHNFDDAFIFVRGQSLAQTLADKPNVCDVAGLVLN
ncbi:alkaline phosphatase family protein [Elusimicrobiota bacterium]